MIGLREAAPGERAVSPARGAPASDAPAALDERALLTLWLLGRVPEAALPLRLLRPGRAGRGPGPDVREATVLLSSGVTRTGDVELHLCASDFARHGHTADPAYAGVILHVAWVDDRPPAERGGPTPHAGGHAPTIAIAPHLRNDPARVHALIARGPSGREPCSDAVARLGIGGAATLIRHEGQRRLAERAWRAARLAERSGWPGAWSALLERALFATAGRHRESEATRAQHLDAIGVRLGGDPLAALIAAAREERPRALIDRVQPPGIGAARAAEIGWNAALPLLSAAAAAYGDVVLARATARLAEGWPAPRPYGRTRALARLAGPPQARAGALYAQGLLHLQDLWCSRGGCGACPLSVPGRVDGASPSAVR